MLRANPRSAAGGSDDGLPSGMVAFTAAIRGWVFSGTDGMACSGAVLRGEAVRSEMGGAALGARECGNEGPGAKDALGANGELGGASGATGIVMRGAGALGRALAGRETAAGGRGGGAGAREAVVCGRGGGAGAREGPAAPLAGAGWIGNGRITVASSCSSSSSCPSMPATTESGCQPDMPSFHTGVSAAMTSRRNASSS